MFELFSFIGREHPFFPQVERLRGRIAAEPRLRDLATGPRTIHAEIKALPEGESWRFDRFYWSLQSRAATPFRAMTLAYSAKSGQTEWQVFPDDSYLKTLGAFFAAPPAALRVLRYVPLRRLTFRSANPLGGTWIGKFKRASRFRQAYDLLGVVADAVAAAAPGFHVSQPLALDEGRCLYFQSALPGDDLAAALSPQNHAPLLRRAGALLRALHEVPAPALQRAAPDAAIETARRDVAFIGFMHPGLAPWLPATLEVLERHVAQGYRGEEVFCHGDFVCSQILAADDAWSITDFDLCHLGDPCRDLAILLASLPYDVPFLSQPLWDGTCSDGAADSMIEAAVRSCSEGYAERAGKEFDPRRLAWQRIAAEIYYLGLMLKKDQFSPAIAAYRLRTIRRLAATLESAAVAVP